LVAIDGFVQAVILLWQQFELKAGKSQPSSLDLCCLPDDQVQAPNGKQVGGRTEVKIDIRATLYLWLLDSVQPPMSIGICFDLNADVSIPKPALYFCRKGSPGIITNNLVVSATGFTRMREYSSSLQLPLRILGI
jgi:hypothetical protein